MDLKKRVIQLNQDVHVYEEWSGYMVEVVVNGIEGGSGKS
jgi:hypothetical protein